MSVPSDRPVQHRAGRVACVQLPALALQLVLRAHPEWQDDPVVIVEDDRPLAEIVWANRVARELRITRGLRFAQAKALSAVLHAEVLNELAIEAAIDEIFQLLSPFSPGIEPRLDQPGLFWIDPQGLQGLFGDHERWAQRVYATLQAARFVGSVVVGFSRGPSWALSCSRQGVLVVRDEVEEQRLAGRVPLDRLGISPALASELALLGVERVGALLALPVAQLRARYGLQASRLHDFLHGKIWTPLLARIDQPPLVLELEVQPPDDDSARLLFGCKSVLQRAVEHLRGLQHAVTALEVSLTLERGGERKLRIESAAPTLDVPQLVDLLRLRLDADAASARSARDKINYVRILVEHVRVHARQRALQHESEGKKPRDLEAAGRAIARLRASLGAGAVTRAKLRPAHLPEASFGFEPTREVALPRTASASGAQLPLVRRLYAQPFALPAIPNHEPEAWLGRHGAVRAMFGPHRIAGGWWSPRGARERDYHFVETQQGALLWLYYDRSKRRWFLHGAVE